MRTSGPRAALGSRASSSIVFIAMIAYAFAAYPQMSRSAEIATHQGSSNPLSEGFGYWPYNGNISSAPLADDMGMPAWEVLNGGPSGNEQAAYQQLGGNGPYGGGLTAAQAADISAHGFVMSLRARVVSGPTYSSTSSPQYLVSGGSSVAGFNGYRYDIALANDGSGNTLVILPTLVGFNGQFSYTPYQAPQSPDCSSGATYCVSGAGYHLYQLSYDPQSGTASLYVDGSEVLTGYAGSAVSGGATANNYGLVFAALNDAEINFNYVDLQSGELSDNQSSPGSGGDGPIPLWALAALGATLVGIASRRLKSAT
jgi:hypothetical protein